MKGWLASTVEVVAGSLLCCVAVPGAAADQAVPVRGSRLTLQVEAEGGRMAVTASQFYELVDGWDPGVAEVRRFVPGELKVKVEGRQSAEYTLLPMAGEQSWHERTVAELGLDQESEWELEPGTAAKEARELWNGVPLRVEIRRSGEGGWLLFIATRDLSLPGGLGKVLRHRQESMWTEKVRRFPLEEGRPVAGEVQTRSEPREIPLDIQVGEARKGEARWHSNLFPPSLSYHSDEGLPANIDTPGKVRSSGTREEISLARLAPASEGGFGGSMVRFTWDFRCGEPPEVGSWKVLEPSLAGWLPSFGEGIRVRVALSRVDAVEALRFVLRETSQISGVAGNAGHGHLLEQAERAAGSMGEVAVILKEGDMVLAWKRLHPEVEKGPRDVFPDLFFEQARNPAGIVEGEEVLSDPSGGRQGTEVRFEKLAAEVDGVVTVADWAAAGVLGVQARIGGQWEDLRASGPGLEPDEVSIRFPLDADGDGVPDAFVISGKEADDGDGLDLQEEYRGMLVGGRHVRMDPEKRDVFVIDYGQALSAEIREGVDKSLAERGARVHWLGAMEHRGERVGKSAGTVVVERLEASALPLILREDDPGAQVRGWKAIRPQPGMNTVFVDRETEARWLAADIWRVVAGPEKGGGK